MRSADLVPRLLEQLDERHPSYRGLSTNAVQRQRGYVLAQFEPLGLPDAALPYAVEALQSGQHAYLVAAGARALRGCKTPAAWMMPLVERALESVRRVDDAFSLDAAEAVWPVATPTSAVRELTATRQWLRDRLTGGSVDACCDLPADLGVSRRACRDPAIDDLAFEDHDGARVLGAELLRGKPTVLAFFYTRCTNPARCSLTITRLGHLQPALSGANLQARLLAVTYDPAYDSPERLRAYGIARGFVPGGDARLLRAPEGMERLRDAFGLGVTYGDVTVSHHRIELFVLDGRGRVTAAFTRVQWNADAVVAAIRDASRRPPGRWLRRLAPAMSSPAALAAAFVPHCPFCWGAYATGLGLPGLALAQPVWLHAAAWGVLALNAAIAIAAWSRSRTRARFAAVTVAANVAMIVATLPGVSATLPPAAVAVVTCVVVALGVSMSSLPRASRAFK
jgi:protein SCO1